MSVDRRKEVRGKETRRLTNEVMLGVIPIDKLESLLDEMNVATPLRDEIVESAKKTAGETNDKDLIVGGLRELLGMVCDEYLNEVTRRVYGFSTGNLSAEERRQIAYIKSQLDLDGPFDPNI